MTFAEEQTIKYAIQETKLAITEIMRQVTVLRERASRLDTMRVNLEKLLPSGKPVEHILEQ